MSKYTVRWPDFEADLAEPNYSFDLVGVWKEDDGFYIGTDSGCSCPSPWESHTKYDLTGPLTFSQMKSEVRNLAKASYRADYAYKNVTAMFKEMKASA